MPRDIDDQMPRRDRAREYGEISGERSRDRERHEQDPGGSDASDPDLRRERGDGRTSWDDDDDDMRQGYR
ncbi:hypothetical protein MBT84_20985 [Streptomyces sp. MBT84]|uniref:hypothetical protein n=1 Tax=unclassified Streptomyces TaxID=2593676 RepID=UPI0007412DA2|nr:MULTISPECIES: hypothetical protein [unclassified Streptomyces]KUJ37881.1 hypothetical protein ADL25_26680 [Streptomyces sp. NRRL F-5122]MBW8702089.1 hypothetical protein [Streptomyces sp. MBT84]MDX3258905.1 hypothetical protein [Streptomyces sp. MI02-2A]REE62235.1 hypothetical protein BX257_4851 [Streptomyces sp. 3212.3]